MNEPTAAYVPTPPSPGTKRPTKPGDAAICHHRNVTEHPRYAIDDPPGHYRCKDCGDTFPLIGDTDQWAPKPIAATGSPLSEDIITAATVARRFHYLYERLAPNFGYETRPESAVPWEDVPDNNQGLMIAVADLILDELGVERDG